MKKWFMAILLLVCVALSGGCSKDAQVRTDGYEYLIGVSLTNVMEPWLNNLVQMITAEAEQGAKRI